MTSGGWRRWRRVNAGGGEGGGVQTTGREQGRGQGERTGEGATKAEARSVAVAVGAGGCHRDEPPAARAYPTWCLSQ